MKQKAKQRLQVRLSPKALAELERRAGGRDRRQQYLEELLTGDTATDLVAARALLVGTLLAEGIAARDLSFLELAGAVVQRLMTVQDLLTSATRHIAGGQQEPAWRSPLEFAGPKRVIRDKK